MMADNSYPVISDGSGPNVSVHKLRNEDVLIK